MLAIQMFISKNTIKSDIHVVNKTICGRHQNKEIGKNGPINNILTQQKRSIPKANNSNLINAKTVKKFDDTRTLCKRQW